MVSTISGEFDDGDNPARNRAVSSAVAGSRLCTGEALSASTSVIRMAAVVLGMDKYVFEPICDDRDPFKAAKAIGMAGDLWRWPRRLDRTSKLCGSIARLYP